jgi:UDP-2-acetamido-2-deoxy-ribo-hexuluronate aminotransferase
MKIEMVDLKRQYVKIQSEIDAAVLNIIRNASFINGPEVAIFERNLSAYLDGSRVIPCANGTDALQIAMMALDLEPGDEVIVPSFTYAASAEIIALLKLKPVMVDVDPDHFNITRDQIEQAIGPRTKVIIPVHLFGQCVDMEPIIELAKEKGLYVIEDAAQAIGAVYTFSNGAKKKAGTIGHIGCTSFFPSKNLGCFGDGGAIFTEDAILAERIKMVANHGQLKKYVHKYIGVNSRLDTIQAAILNIKLKYLDQYTTARRAAADLYNKLLSGVNEIQLPKLERNSTHVYHQYTIKVADGRRDELMRYLNEKGIPSIVYYPIPLNEQEAFSSIATVVNSLNETKSLCASVLSLPMHTELTYEQQVFISDSVRSFFKK